MAQDSYAHLIGAHVALLDDAGPLTACNACGSVVGKVATATLPHKGRLECARCGEHISFLSGRHLDAINAMRARRRGAA